MSKKKKTIIIMLSIIALLLIAFAASYIALSFEDTDNFKLVGKFN